MKLTKKQLKKIIKEELEEELNESPSMEHITPENIMMVISVLKDLGLLAIPAAAAAMGISKAFDKTGKEEIPEK